MLLVYALLYLLILRAMPHHDRLERGQGVSLISSVLIVFAVVVLSLATNPLFTQAAEMFVIGQIYSFICCVFFLWMQVSYRRAMASQHESDVLTVRTEESRRQRRSETAAYRNMLSMSRALRDMLSDALGEEKAGILEHFDRISERYTGELSPHSEILNIILQEKKLRTAGKVEWTCACDAQRMTFLDVNDVYTILGNALDNAIECVMGYEEPEKRMIDVQVFSRKELLSIRVDNYCDQTLQFDGDLPVTTKDSMYFPTSKKRFQIVINLEVERSARTHQRDIKRICVILIFIHIEHHVVHIVVTHKGVLIGIGVNHRLTRINTSAPTGIVTIACTSTLWD